MLFRSDRVGPVAQVVQQETREQLHRPEGVADLVRQHGGHLAHGSEPALAQRLGLEPSLALHARGEEAVLLLELGGQARGPGAQRGVLPLEPCRRGGEAVEGARQAMELLEAEVRADGLPGIDLNVWGGNDLARSLYRSLGFEERAVFMSKELA